MKNRKNQKGQGLVEYLILVCLISVSAIAVVSVVGTNLREQYARISHAITGQGSNPSFSNPDKSSYQRRGMNDYAESAKSNHR